jgi:hypothetical protein
MTRRKDLIVSDIWYTAYTKTKVPTITAADKEKYRKSKESIVQKSIS